MNVPGLPIAAFALAALLPLPATAQPTPSASSTPGPGAAADFLIGHWSCGGADWTFARLAADSPWIRNVYGKDGDHPDGSALIGFVPALGGFVYRDFHFDGSYAELLAKPPVDGRWVWIGSYYPTSGDPLEVRITYVTSGPALYERIFERFDGTGYVKAGGDSCAKRT